MKARIIVLGVLAVFICAGLAVSVQAAKPGIDFNGPHYGLNIIGKDVDWKGNGNGYDNGHTMFVPENTSDFNITVWDEGVETVVPGIRINITQGDAFDVIDGNAFDDGTCAFELAPGKYHVYIAAKAKPVGHTNIVGWVQANDTYYFDIGDVQVSKSKKAQWDDATNLFYVSGQEEPDALGMLSNQDNVWVFDYLTALNTYDPTLYPNLLYFWQYDNHGSKLVQVRFYEV
ncbi:hypothetical protein [Methanococcoides seepicolus]|uniref:Uncharacterized protein n=1 Tax=Methanococcoides seepicolus TaxID=2828780 RepID=A0A9E4ZK45_9EURY|nr:hypothetical protein [Methanococcoides seepicolus]MCM1988043.1 hypothetical protein [Methanococcoides seepicolus]